MAGFCLVALRLRPIKGLPVRVHGLRAFLTVPAGDTVCCHRSHAPMYDHNQSQLPHSFIELFIPPGKMKPSETREVIAARYDLCEDMAQMLTEHASAKLFELGVTENDVLERMHLGLLQDPAAVTAPEARWIVCRLAELLDWPMGAWLKPD